MYECSKLSRLATTQLVHLSIRTLLQHTQDALRISPPLSAPDAVRNLPRRRRPLPAGPRLGGGRKSVATGLEKSSGGRVKWGESLRLPAAEAVLVSVFCGCEMLGSAVVAVGDVARCGARGVNNVFAFSLGKKGRGKRSTIGTVEVYGEDQSTVLSTLTVSSAYEATQVYARALRGLFGYASWGICIVKQKEWY